jgi:FkbM family methyltransferase
MGYEFVRAHRGKKRSPLFGLAMGFGAALSRQISVVQVGANDGDDEMRDVVKTLQAKSLLIEPNAELLPNLLNNYDGCKHVTVECLAVDEECGNRTLYVVQGKSRTRYESLGLSPTGISSFNENHVRKHLEHFLGRSSSLDIGKMEVPTAPLWHIAKQKGFFGADILQIDTEGYDFCVLKTAKLEEWKPAIVSLEASHLSSQELIDCQGLLTGAGYECYEELPDLIAFRAPTCDC